MDCAGKSGVFLRLVEEEFEVFLTAHQKLPNQQNLKTFKIAWYLLQSVTACVILNRSCL